MHILGAGRSAFLEFLRNITPTALMASIAFVAWAQLDFSRLDLNNWKATAVFWVCFITASLSLAANVLGFLEKAFAFPLGLERGIRRLRRRGHSTPVLIWSLLRLAARAKPWILLEAIVALIVIYAATIGATMSGASIALTALKNGLR